MIQDFLATAAQVGAIVLSVQPTVAALVSAACVIAAALTSQRAYEKGKQGELPTYFGGRPVEESFLTDENTMRTDGVRERVKAHAAYLQSHTTSLLVLTALFGLCASVPNPLVGCVALIGFVIVLKPMYLQRKAWYREDRRFEARTENYIFYQSHKHGWTPGEIDRLFAQEHPDLARWL